MTNPVKGRPAWVLMVSAAVVLMITMGSRQTVGLFITPIDHATGLGIASISFALAIGQFVWGLAQPIFGMFADKYGSFPALVTGALMLTAGLALTPFASSEWAVVATMGILSAAGAGAGSFSILIGASSKYLPPERRAFASGFINAGGSFGQFIFAPVVQIIINAFGWVTAILALAASSLMTIPISRVLSGGGMEQKVSNDGGSGGLIDQLGLAIRDRSYLCLHAGFFTCGFHVAFLVTHLPGEVALCGHSAFVSAASISLIGLFNIAGSLFAGWLGTFYRMKYILSVMYASRVVMIGIYLLAPKRLTQILCKPPSWCRIEAAQWRLFYGKKES